MVTSTKKTGRKTAVYYPKSGGGPVIGLFRLGDGRWRVSGPIKYTFSEPDEQLAIAQYRAWQAKQLGQDGQITLPVATIDSQGKVNGGLPPTSPDTRRIKGNIFPPALIGVMPGEPNQIELAGDTLVVGSHKIHADILFGWIREQIIKRPKWLAERVGIEQIGYLADLTPPAPSATLDEVGTLYFANAKISENWLAKSKQFWAEFIAIIGTKNLRELTQDDIIRYGDQIKNADNAPTYARQRFGAIKAILNYPPKRGKWAEDAKRAVALCAVLVPPRKSATDPKPIAPQDFQKLLAAANTQMQALLLLALNCAMYGGEVAALNWSDVDLTKATLVTARNKTGIVRIATLWPRTIKVLKALQTRKDVDALFLTEAGTQASYLIINRAFKKLRKVAKLPAVQFSQIRDGAYTAAVEAGTDLNLCRLLAGHSTGISDHYVKRRPGMVAPACQAIAKAYCIEE